MSELSSEFSLKEQNNLSVSVGNLSCRSSEESLIVIKKIKPDQIEGFSQSRLQKLQSQLLKLQNHLEIPDHNECQIRINYSDLNYAADWMVLKNIQEPLCLLVNQAPDALASFYELAHHCSFISFGLLTSHSTTDLPMILYFVEGRIKALASLKPKLSDNLSTLIWFYLS